MSERKKFKNTYAFEVLKFLFQCDQIRRSDLNAFATTRYYSSYDNARKEIQKMVNEGYIEVVEYYSPKTKKTEPIYRITNKGRNLIIEKEEDRYYLDSRRKFERIYGATPLENGAEETEKVEKLLRKAGIYSMFAACGIPVFVHDKPSFDYFMDTLTGGTNAEKKPGYKDGLTLAECRDILKKGIFYTMKEMTDYANKLSDEVKDTITGTRAQGVFISNKSCYVVYAARKHNNKIMKTYNKSDKGLLNFLSVILFKATSVYRVIPELKGYDSNFNLTGDRNQVFRNEPYALLISDGEMLSYATATGFAKGKISERSLSIRKKAEEGKAVPKYGDTDETGNKYPLLLTADNQFYKKIYVVETNSTGLLSLGYLLQMSIEDQIKDGKRVMLRNRKVFEEYPTADNVYKIFEHTTGLLRDVIYMPVFEAKEAAAAFKSGCAPVILTYSDLLNPIAHSIRKDCAYYDIEEEKLFDKDCAFIYNECGEIAGEKMLDSFLNEQYLTFDKKKEGRDLPKRLGVDRKAFYNSIARGETDVEEIAKEMNTKELVKDTSYRRKKKTHLTLYISTEDKEEIEALAERQGLSLARYMMREHRAFMKIQRAARPDIDIYAGKKKGAVPCEPFQDDELLKLVHDTFGKFK